MLQRLKALVQSISNAFAAPARPPHDASQPIAPPLKSILPTLSLPPMPAPRAFAMLGVLCALSGAAYFLYYNPPMRTVGRGEMGVRTNAFTGAATEFSKGKVLALLGLHDLRTLNMRDQTFQSVEMRSATGAAPLQSLEGLSLGVDLSVRFALDPTKLSAIAKRLPENVGAEIVQPAVQGIVYKVFARYSIREIFSTKRVEIQQAIEAELKPKLAADGIVVRDIFMGKVDLPADYKRGMDGLLAEELATTKMRYTLELKDKRVKETELDGEAEKMRREKAAEAAGREQIIAAKSQEEAMKHILPFKQRQVEQRQLEAEADKVSRIRIAEGQAAARTIEAKGEAEARQKLADAEVYRLDKVGRVNSEQMGREGVLVTRHPLLIQKAMADKLSDKIQVIIAPPPSDGSFIGNALLGANKRNAAPEATVVAAAADADKEKEKE